MWAMKPGSIVSQPPLSLRASFQSVPRKEISTSSNVAVRVQPARCLQRSGPTRTRLAHGRARSSSAWKF